MARMSNLSADLARGTRPCFVEPPGHARGTFFMSPLRRDILSETRELRPQRFASQSEALGACGASRRVGSPSTVHPNRCVPATWHSNVACQKRAPCHFPPMLPPFLLSCESKKAWGSGAPGRAFEKRGAWYAHGAGAGLAGANGQRSSKSVTSCSPDLRLVTRLASTSPKSGELPTLAENS